MPRTNPTLLDATLVIAGVGVGDATAAGRHAVEAAFVQGLERSENRPRLPDLLRFDQLLAAAELARGSCNRTPQTTIG